MTPASIWRSRSLRIFLLAALCSNIGSLVAGETAQALGPSGPRWVLGGEGLILLVTALWGLTVRRPIPDVPPSA